MPHIFTVREITSAVKDVLESQFSFLWVRGQVSDIQRPGSGHLYFTLKDEYAQLAVVWFKNARQAMDMGQVNPVTGEVMEHGFIPDVIEGQELLVAGRLHIYEPRGTYQLVAEFVQDQGVGQLYLQFEAMKTRLQEKGYFAKQGKKVLPESPKKVAVVTAPTGAAVMDFLRIARERGAGSTIRIYPVLVQGDKSARQIAEALDRICTEGWAQMIVLIRGGGAIEDLQAFNTETVADAIYKSCLPVLTGVGHEVDTTIADYVADARAATPSHAAQMLWPRQSDLMQMLDRLEFALIQAGQRTYKEQAESLSLFIQALSWFTPDRQLKNMQEKLTELTEKLAKSLQAPLDEARKNIRDTACALPRLAGKAVLQKQQNCSILHEDIVQGIAEFLNARENTLFVLQTRLEALNPLAPLKRGYGLMFVEGTDRLLRSIKHIKKGQDVTFFLADGSITAKVLAKNFNRKK